MITGKWADIGKFKGPILRALAARAPYFHNGSAETLEEVVEFYETRFNIGLTAREIADLWRSFGRSESARRRRRSMQVRDVGDSIGRLREGIRSREHDDARPCDPGRHRSSPQSQNKSALPARSGGENSRAK